MIYQKKSRFKPLYKQFLKLRENVQNRKKLLSFQKKKWNKFKIIISRKSKWYRKWKPKDQTQYVVSKYPNRGSSYYKRYKNTLIVNKKFKLFYGGLSKKFIKKQIRKVLYQNYENLILKFLKFFENRLDVILYRSLFCKSIRSARQLILHNKILVNKKLIRIGSYLLKEGDFITVEPKSFDYIKANVRNSLIWCIPPKHLSINYRTLQIIFRDPKNTNLSLNFSYHLHLEKILTSYY